MFGKPATRTATQKLNNASLQTASPNADRASHGTRAVSPHGGASTDTAGRRTNSHQANIAAGPAHIAAQNVLKGFWNSAHASGKNATGQASATMSQRLTELEKDAAEAQG